MGEPHVIVHIPLYFFGLNLSVTNFVIMLWVAAVISFLLLAGAAWAVTVTGTGRLPNLVESLLEFVRENISDAFMGHHGAKWFPFVATVFFFVLFSNLLGLVPVPGYFHAGTSNLNVTATLAIIVFLVVQAVAVKTHGPKYYLGLLFPKSAPAWLRFSLMPFIELIGVFARPFSLAIRLFANMTAGHQIILVLLTGELVGATWMLKQGIIWKFLSPAPLIGVIVMDGFEIFVAFIQAFIFALLAALYLGEALEESH
ncbi:MAG TPA: F0F1 ATP synthase subunit A [Verrucomicrobiae bacterium]|nr:F0F1 ATP synthase subunit A [Verrucomicrobiae bacterium]